MSKPISSHSTHNADSSEPATDCAGTPIVLERSEAERLSAIIATQQIIATSQLDRVSLMNLIVERAQSLTQADGAAFEFHEEEDMVYRACCGNTAPFLGLRLNIHTSLSGKCVLTGEIMRCDDSDTDPRVDRAACRKIGVRSMIVVPLSYGQTVVGVLKVLSARPSFFTERDVQTLELMAGLFGAVVYQASAFDAQREALRHSEQQHRTLFETTPQGVVYMDAEGVITAANSAAERLLGLDAAQLQGHTSRDLHRQTVHEDGSPCPAEEMPSLIALRTGQSVREQVIGVFHQEQGNCRWFRVDSIPQFRPGETRPFQVYSLFTDITTQKEADAQRERHRREVEDLNASLRRAITETHHRMKNSLQVLLAMMDMDLMDKPETVPVSRLEHLSANVRALALLHDILTQHSKNDWHNSTLSTRTVLTRLLHLLQDTLAVPLRLTDIADVALSLGRGTALALMTNELALNAVKHGRGRVEVGLVEEGERLRFWVADEGPGFAPGFRPERDANTGLELVITLARHDLGGEIVFENRAEGGAQVVVTFASQAQTSSFF